MVPPPFRSEGSTLPIAVPSHFESFFRANLRRVVGSRVRSSALMEAYLAWAVAAQRPSINYHQLRRYMLVAGHRRVKSNGIQYLDVAFAADAPEVADGYATLPPDRRSQDGWVDLVVSAIDQALSALRQLRLALAGRVQ